MAFATFDFTANASPQTSTTITLGTGEAVRVRFSLFSGNNAVDLGIIRNGITTYQRITDKEAYIGNALSGDQVFVRALTIATGAEVAGIVEGIS